jgi:hypothetical protein
MELRRLIIEYDEVLIISRPGIVRPVKTAGDHILRIDHKKFIVQDPPLAAALEMHRDPGVHQALGDVVYTRRLALIVHQANFHTALFGTDERLSDIFVGQTVDRAVQRGEAELIQDTIT